MRRERSGQRDAVGNGERGSAIILAVITLGIRSAMGIALLSTGNRQAARF